MLWCDVKSVAHTACSRWKRARSAFFVYNTRMFPSWRWVRASTLGGGLKLKTVCKHWMHNRMFGGVETRKCSAKPSRARYQASWDDVDAIVPRIVEMQSLWYNTYALYNCSCHAKTHHLKRYCNKRNFFQFILQYNTTIDSSVAVVCSAISID